MIERLTKIHQIALTTDLWKNKNDKYFMSISAHFFDEKFNYISRTIGFKRIASRHLTKNLENFLLDELQRLKIQREKIQSITTDNGADIKKAAAAVSHRLSCTAHNLNLALKKV
jgi:hypothetical protein